MLNPLDLTNRTILVSGASSGIGRETAMLLRRWGARVVLVARSQENLALRTSKSGPEVTNRASPLIRRRPAHTGL